MAPCSLLVNRTSARLAGDRASVHGVQQAEHTVLRQKATFAVVPPSLRKPACQILELMKHIHNPSAVEEVSKA